MKTDIEIQTPRLSKAMLSGDRNTFQLLEIAANEIPSGDPRDLLLGASKLFGKLQNQLTSKITP